MILKIKCISSNQRCIKLSISSLSEQLSPCRRAHPSQDCEGLIWDSLISTSEAKTSSKPGRSSPRWSLSTSAKPQFVCRMSAWKLCLQPARGTGYSAVNSASLHVSEQLWEKQEAEQAHLDKQNQQTRGTFTKGSTDFSCIPRKKREFQQTVACECTWKLHLHQKENHF